MLITSYFVYNNCTIVIRYIVTTITRR